MSSPKGLGYKTCQVNTAAYKTLAQDNKECERVRRGEERRGEERRGEERREARRGEKQSKSRERLHYLCC